MGECFRGVRPSDSEARLVFKGALTFCLHWVLYLVISELASTEDLVSVYSELDLMLDFLCFIWFMKDSYELQNRLFIAIQMAVIPNLDNIKCWWGCGGTGTLTHCWECKMMQPLRKVRQFQSIQQCTGRYIPTWAENSCPHKNCTKFYRHFVHNCPKTWKWIRCPSTDEQINYSISTI
jgi:hypothetical protein